MLKSITDFKTLEINMTKIIYIYFFVYSFTWGICALTKENGLDIPLQSQFLYVVDQETNITIFELTSSTNNFSHSIVTLIGSSILLTSESMLFCNDNNNKMKLLSVYIFGTKLLTQSNIFAIKIIFILFVFIWRLGDKSMKKNI